MSCENNSKILSRIQIRRIVKMMKSRGYVVYTDPFKLNIVGVRNPNTNPKKFDDNMYVFWKDDNNLWNGKEYVITTDPSTVYLEKGGFSSSTSGVAIMAHGQYIDAYKLRTHTGYPALSQRGDICIYRDYDRDSTLFFDIDTIVCKSTMGINIHRAKKGGADDGQGNTENIGLYSAGCQVFQNYYCFLEFMDMCRKQVSIYGDGGFTYTLIDKSLERKFRIKRTLYWTSMALSIGLISYGVWLNKDKPALPFISNPKLPSIGRAKGELLKNGFTNIQYIMNSPKKPVLLFKGTINSETKGIAVGRRPGTDVLFIETFKLK